MVSICRHEIWRSHLGCWSASLPSPHWFLKALREALNTRGRSDVDTNGEKLEKAKWSTSSCFLPPQAVTREIKQSQDSKPNSWKKGRSKVCSLSPVTLPILEPHSSLHTYLPWAVRMGEAGQGPFPPALCGGRCTGSAEGAPAPPNSHCWQPVRKWK